MESNRTSTLSARKAVGASIAGFALVGISTSVTIFLLIAPRAFLSTPSIQVLQLVVAIVSGSCWLIARNWWNKRSSAEVTRARRGWLVFSLICAALLLRAIPFTPPIPPIFATSTLTITATGEKNPASAGAEVWVLGIASSAGSQVPVSEFKQDGKWEIRGEQILCYQSQPARLEWKGSVAGTKELLLLAHPYSGIAEVCWGTSTTQRVDLYAREGGLRRIALPTSRDVERRENLIGLALFACCAVSLGILILPIFAFIGQLQLRPSEPPRCFWRTAVAHASLCACTWSIGLAAFWPGLMSPDSLEQWGQVLSGNYQDHHPAFHTMTMRLVTGGRNLPAVVAILQIVALSMVVGWTMAHMRRWGARRWLVWTSTALMAFSPVNLPMVVCIWKDIPFSIAMLLLSAMILVCVSSNGQWLRRLSCLVALAVTAALACLYRHNGPPPALASMALLVFAFREWRWRAMLALVLSAGLFFAVRGPVYKAFDVRPGATLSGGVWLIAHHFAAHLDAGTPMSEQEREVVRRVRRDPVAYDPYQASTLVSSKYFDPASAQAARHDALKLLLRLTWRNPFVAYRHIREQSSLVWRITKPAGSYYYNTALESRDEPRVRTMSQAMGLDLSPKLPRLHHALTRMNDWTLVHLQAWVWRTPIYLYLFLLGTVFACIRTRNFRFALVTAPVFLNSALLALVTTGQDFRYQLPAYWAGLVLGPYLLFMPNKNTPPIDRTPSSCTLENPV